MTYVCFAGNVVGEDVVLQSGVQRVVGVLHPFEHGGDLMAHVLIIGDLRVERVDFLECLQSKDRLQGERERARVDSIRRRAVAPNGCGIGWFDCSSPGWILSWLGDGRRFRKSSRSQFSNAF